MLFNPTQGKARIATMHTRKKSEVLLESDTLEALMQLVGI
jgi:hypothetical protein